MSLVCDFCYEPDPTWNFPAHTYESTEALGATSEGNWAACETCAHYIQTSQWNRLAKRALNNPSAKEALPQEATPEELLRMIKKFHQEFNSHRNGPGFRFQKVQ